MKRLVKRRRKRSSDRNCRNWLTRTGAPSRSSKVFSASRKKIANARKKSVKWKCFAENKKRSRGREKSAKKDCEQSRGNKRKSCGRLKRNGRRKDAESWLKELPKMRQELNCRRSDRRRRELQKRKEWQRVRA